MGGNNITDMAGDKCVPKKRQICWIDETIVIQVYHGEKVK